MNMSQKQTIKEHSAMLLATERKMPVGSFGSMASPPLKFSAPFENF